MVAAVGGGAGTAAEADVEVAADDIAAARVTLDTAVATPSAVVLLGLVIESPTPAPSTTSNNACASPYMARQARLYVAQSRNASALAANEAVAACAHTVYSGVPPSKMPTALAICNSDCG